MQQIKSFGILQTATVSGALYFAFSLIFLIPFVVLSQAFTRGQYQGPSWAPFLLLLVPILYAVLGFVITAITCWVYNLVAKWVGAIEIELE